MAKMPDSIKISVDMQAIADTYKTIADMIKQLDAAQMSTHTAIKTFAPALPAPTGTFTERSWCIGGPFDCQWKKWHANSEIYIPKVDVNSQFIVKGTYRFAGELEDDEGKYRVYQWLGWDGTNANTATVKLHGVSISNGGTFSISYDEIV